MLASIPGLAIVQKPLGATSIVAAVATVTVDCEAAGTSTSGGGSEATFDYEQSQSRPPEAAKSDALKDVKIFHIFYRE